MLLRNDAGTIGQSEEGATRSRAVVLAFAFHSSLFQPAPHPISSRQFEGDARSPHDREPLPTHAHPHRRAMGYVASFLD